MYSSLYCSKPTNNIRWMYDRLYFSRSRPTHNIRWMYNSDRLYWSRNLPTQTVLLKERAYTEYFVQWTGLLITWDRCTAVYVVQSLLLIISDECMTRYIFQEAGLLISLGEWGISTNFCVKKYHFFTQKFVEMSLP